MIISASRRTDIPCYYSDWLINRIRAGYVLTRNPMNHGQISRINLSPCNVDCIVFWTKDARNITDRLHDLDNAGYRYYFQFTITPYDRTIERNLRDKTDIENTFTELSRIIGKERVIWRYDPVLLSDNIDLFYHKEHFKRMCYKLCNYTESVTVSFVDMYSKLNTKAFRCLTVDETEELSIFLSSTAKDHGLRISACCEQTDLSVYGIEKASCIDKNLIERVFGIKPDFQRDKYQRRDCGCCQSVDIGAYNTCKNGCIYCYANYSVSSVERNCKKHNPKGELLIGEISEGDKITDRKI